MAADDKHIAITLHQAWSSVTQLQSDTLFMQTDNLMKMAEAYNNRQSIILNGITYDFSNKTGRVEFCLTGHTHVDKESVHYNIPVISTINAYNGKVITFDLMLVDYENRVINCIRVGNGNDRVISL